MKKLILIVCAVAAFADLFAEDSYLYWMVNDTITMDGAEYDWAAGPLAARVVAYNNNTGKSEYLSLYGQNAAGGLVPVRVDAVSGVSQVTVNGMNSPFYAGIASSMAVGNWSYFVELYNEAILVRSETSLDYPTAQTMAYLKGSDLKPGKYWSVAAFTPKPVPEPNSALLMLIGCAALALRRRKQIAA